MSPQPGSSVPSPLAATALKAGGCEPTPSSSVATPSSSVATLSSTVATPSSTVATPSSSVASPRSRAYSRSGRMKAPVEGSQVIMEGELEKRGENLLQLWKKKVCVLTKDSLAIFADVQKRSRCKELKFQSIKKLDCVERTGKYIYFTIVTTENKEIDFRCSDESCWNAAITMALIDFQNKKAIQHFKARQGPELARQPSNAERPAARCV